MSENKREKVIVQKIKAYPIPCTIPIVEGKPPLTVQIVHLEEHGFIFKATGHYFRPTEDYQCQFEIPVIGKFINQPIRIIKTYEAIETAGSQRMMTVECHFKDLNGDFRGSIHDFIHKIGQKKKI